MTQEDQLVFSETEWQAICQRLGLSPRQIQISRCLMQARCDKDIALEIGIKMPTLRTHIDRMFRKVGAHDRAEFMLRVVKEFRAAFAPQQMS